MQSPSRAVTSSHGSDAITKWQVIMGVMQSLSHAVTISHQNDAISKPCSDKFTWEWCHHQALQWQVPMGGTQSPSFVVTSSQRSDAITKPCSDKFSSEWCNHQALHLDKFSWEWCNHQAMQWQVPIWVMQSPTLAVTSSHRSDAITKPCSDKFPYEWCNHQSLQWQVLMGVMQSPSHEVTSSHGSDAITKPCCDMASPHTRWSYLHTNHIIPLPSHMQEQQSWKWIFGVQQNRHIGWSLLFTWSSTAWYFTQHTAMTKIT